ncbi:MAG: hypothetical protein LBQ16_00290 [Gracilibacteraceae bacterium]|jgi:hypothetical protein|nr:hypothetical protein [Gracilibacteraceae bacterium]
MMGANRGETNEQQGKITVTNVTLENLRYHLIFSSSLYWIISISLILELELAVEGLLILIAFAINTSNEVLVILMWLYGIGNKKMLLIIFAVNFAGEFFGVTLFYNFIDCIRSWLIWGVTG